MYNGLPWPEEEFTRVTMERDLKIVQRLDDNPIIWKVLPHFLPLFLNLRISTSIFVLFRYFGVWQRRGRHCVTVPSYFEGL